MSTRIFFRAAVATGITWIVAFFIAIYFGVQATPFLGFVGLVVLFFFYYSLMS